MFARRAPALAPALRSRYTSPAMIDPLRALLQEKTIVLADGAMGTSLFGRGLETGDAPELWCVDRPEEVAAVHRAFAAAGAQVLLTNSFGANRYRLALHGAQARVAELNAAAARLARAGAAAVPRPVLVAGSMGPTGEILAPLGALEPEAAAEAFAEQALALAEGGCDLLWIETVSAAEELQAAVAGAARAGLPVVATMTFDTRGRTMMGLTPAAALQLSRQLAVPLAGFGANCGIGPAQLVDSVLALDAAAGDGNVVLVAKGNCGVPHWHDGELRYDGTPQVMAAYAQLARDAGASVIGGCCGTTPVHLEAMAAALATQPRGPRPDLATVERLLGPLQAEAPSAAPSASARRPRRRRGRGAHMRPREAG